MGMVQMRGSHLLHIPVSNAYTIYSQVANTVIAGRDEANVPLSLCEVRDDSMWHYALEDAASL